MFQIERNFSKLPKYYLKSKVLWNHKSISNITDPEKFEKNKDLSNINCCYNESIDSFLCEKSNISIGIVGSGLTAVYATVLLKQNLLIKRIHLIDTKNILEGTITDACFMDTSPKIKYYKKKFMKDALKDMDIVALLDETDFKMGNDSIRAQFMTSVKYVRQTAGKIVSSCPTALLAVFARPVTATLPLVSEIYKFAGWWDPNRIMGSVALEAMRLESFTSRLLDLNPAFLTVPLAGGADSCTTVPLLSATRPINEFTKVQEDMLINKFRSVERELKLTESEGPTISSAAAIAKFVNTLIAGISGHDKAIACAYVRSNILPFCRFFTSELKFGPNGIEKNFGLPKVSQKEIMLIEKSVNHVNEYVDIAIGEAHKKKEKSYKIIIK